MRNFSASSCCSPATACQSNLRLIPTSSFPTALLRPGRRTAAQRAPSQHPSRAPARLEYTPPPQRSGHSLLHGNGMTVDRSDRSTLHLRSGATSGLRLPRHRLSSGHRRHDLPPGCPAHLRRSLRCTPGPSIIVYGFSLAPRWPATCLPAQGLRHHPCRNHRQRHRGVPVYPRPRPLSEMAAVLIPAPDSSGFNESQRRPLHGPCSCCTARQTLWSHQSGPRVFAASSSTQKNSSAFRSRS